MPPIANSTVDVALGSTDVVTFVARFAAGVRSDGNSIESQCLEQLVDDLLGAPRDHRGGHARLEVVAEHEPIRGLELSLNCRQLLHHIRAVLVVLDHPQDRIQVAAGRSEAVHD